MKMIRVSGDGFFRRVTCLCIAVMLICGSGLFGGIVQAETRDTESNNYPVEAIAPISKGLSTRFDSQRYAEAFVQKALSYEGTSQKHLGYTIAWCASFVGRCAKEAGIPDSVIPNNIPTVSTFLDTMIKRGYKAYKVADLKSGDYKPEVGDLVFEDTTKKLGHIGIICKVNENGSFYTIDGNITDESGVSRVRKLLFAGDGEPLDNPSTINSFIRPDYAAIDRNAIATPKAKMSVVKTNGSAGGFNTAALRMESSAYSIMCGNYLGETSPFDMKLFGWGSEKNTLSVFILDDDSTNSLDAEVSVFEKIDEKQFHNVQVSSYNKYTNATYYDFFDRVESGVFPLEKGVGAPTIRLRYYNRVYHDVYVYYYHETYVAYDSVGFYYLLLTPSEAKSYLETEKYTLKYYEPNGTGYKPVSKTVQIPGLKKLLNTQKIR